MSAPQSPIISSFNSVTTSNIKTSSCCPMSLNQQTGNNIWDLGKHKLQRVLYFSPKKQNINVKLYNKKLSTNS